MMELTTKTRIAETRIGSHSAVNETMDTSRRSRATVISSRPLSGSGRPRRFRCRGIFRTRDGRQTFSAIGMRHQDAQTFEAWWVLLRAEDVPDRGAPISWRLGREKRPRARVRPERPLVGRIERRGPRFAGVFRRERIARFERGKPRGFHEPAGGELLDARDVHRAPVTSA